MTVNSAKFDRQYRLTIDPADGGDVIVITKPFTLQFLVQRRMFSALNLFNGDIYNLSEGARNRLFQEPWSDRKKRVTLEMGYDTLTTVFTGFLWSGHTQREGADIVTSIECKSEIWDLTETTIYETINSGQTVGDILNGIAGNFTQLSIGAIGDYPDKLLRPVVLNGNAWQLFKQYSDNTAFVDNGRIYALKKTEAIEGEFIYITPQSGLLATPKRELGTLQVQMLLEPRIKMGQIVGLDATASRIYNGNYKVYGIQHMGTISSAVGGDCRTILDLFVGGVAFKMVPSNG